MTEEELAERNRLSAELAYAHMALEVFAEVYDEFLKAKGSAWCKHWEAVPLNQFRDDAVPFRFPTLEDCRRAKEAIGGE